jgi:amidase
VLVLRNCIVAGVLVLALRVGSVSAFTYVTDADGTWWGIQDAASPGVDTGSIRGTQIAAGQSGALSTSINGFGGIRVFVDATPAPRFNGELMRGFGLTFDGVDRFRTTQSVNVGGVTISRAIFINRSANWGRWLDTFTNTTKAPLTIKVAFGGQSGLGASGSNSSSIVNTSSGDAKVAPGDAWVAVVTPLDSNKPDTMIGGPQITVTGSFDFAGNWLHDTFATPLSYTGHEGNFQAYVNSITLPPGKSRSLLHFIVLGQRVNAASSAGVRAALEATAAALAASPELGGLTPGEICTIANFDTAKQCTATGETTDVVAQPAAPAAKPARTRARYDVVEKTIGQLRADMEAGITMSQEITRAYLDRIEVYDKGQFGFHAYEIVAADAMAQAQAADAARKAGRRGPLLGIPIAVKNNYDSKDMATTNGSFAFEDFRPAQDAFQVAKLREAGAVLIGKAALEEYATSGFYSNDAWGQVWNVHKPSKSALGSSGGSASAVAGSLAAGALGSQTGDSLYAPASAQSLVTLRGTDGLQSGSGIMPLTWMMDYGGAMTRSVSDLADMLNVLAVPDAQDPATLRRPQGVAPANWRTVLDVNALRGKRIGYIPSVWVDPLGTTNTLDASKAALKFLEAAGATIVEMGVTVGDSGDAPPNITAPVFEGGSIVSEGWRQYIDSHPELRMQGFQIVTEIDVRCSQKKVPYVREAPGDCAATPNRRLTQSEIQAHRDYRQITRPAGLDKWMDEAGADNLGVDAIVYPGLLSDVSLNDGGGARAAFGRRDTPSAATGSPTIVIPAGVDTHGQPINIQLLGRAWDDAKLVGFAYAFEQIATAAGRGHVAPATVPALRYETGK